MRADTIIEVSFKDLCLNEPFFDSLKSAYPNFEDWFHKKADLDEHVYVSRNIAGSLIAMMYLKSEEDTDWDVSPVLIGPRLKIGTFKIDFGHHTGLGRRYLAKALRIFSAGDYDYIYVTMFANSENTLRLDELLHQYGFERWGAKGQEEVLVKPRPDRGSGDPRFDFPFISLEQGADWVLSIHPSYHLKMFGESELRSEWGVPKADEKVLNSIEKVYLSGSKNVADISPGDRLLIYRTSDKLGPAIYRSVISGICVVLETRHIATFESYSEFASYIASNSVFTANELRQFWRNKPFQWVIKMLYNQPFKKYPTRKLLLDQNLIPSGRIVCERISSSSLLKISRLGEVNESSFIN